MTIATATWQEHAACRDSDPAIFFPTGAGPNEYGTARLLCSGCDVTAECLDYAMRVEPRGTAKRHGMFGGLTPAQRERLGGPIVKACEVCDREFVARAPRATCGDECWSVKEARRKKDWNDANRVKNLPSVSGRRHGTITMAHSGCKCLACKRRRKVERRKYRRGTA